MERLAPVLEVITLLINLFSVLILIIGILLCAKNLVLVFFSGKTQRGKMLLVHQAKTELGGFVLLGLEILIVADIIESIINPTLNDLIRLAVIVAIRTLISHFLGKEITEVRSAGQDPEHGVEDVLK